MGKNCPRGLEYSPLLSASGAYSRAQLFSVLIINLFFGGGGVTSFESGKRDSNKRHVAYKAAKTKKSNTRMIFSNWLLL